MHTAGSLYILHTPSHSYVPVPLTDMEAAGWWSLIHWHCGLPMRRVFSLDDAEVVRPKAWICMFCERRQYPPLIK